MNLRGGEREAELRWYRIPADPAGPAATGPGEFAPPPAPLPRRDGDRDAALAELRRAAAPEEVRDRLRARAARTELPSP